MEQSERQTPLLLTDGRVWSVCPFVCLHLGEDSGLVGGWQEEEKEVEKCGERSEEGTAGETPAPTSCCLKRVVISLPLSISYSPPHPPPLTVFPLQTQLSCSKLSAVPVHPDPPERTSSCIYKQVCMLLSMHT
ncbi:hypothetical protein PBY51_009322 [Eleginops maclovinus]|uniref:Uncharacterized protein n=1 Tax=Eleginops maclovinus TaxID=56733 RepID=A0AAN7XTU9_ELEMC|nr:hypothetical protein PBY51_009322 [Eleginops maclovinus]